MTVVVVTRALVTGWWIVLGATGLGGAAAFVVSSATPAVYQASTSYYVSVAGQDTTSAGEIAQGSTAAQQKIKSYIELVSSPRVLGPVVSELGLDTTAAALGRDVSATVTTGTVIIVIVVRDPSAEDAAAIARAVGTSLASVVSEIEPAAADGAPSVRLEPVMPATTPGAPVSPRRAVDLAVGIAGGAALGVLLALLRAAADTRLRSGDDLDVDVPVVGDIAFDADAARRPLIVHEESSSPRAEAFRSLRTNIQFLSTVGDTPSIAITSARPAEGKTTTTTNLGIALSSGGLRTVLVDADLRRPNVATLMGLEGSAGLTDVLVGRAELDDVLQEWGTTPLSVLPAGTVPPNPSELVGSAAMALVLADLGRRFDVVLVDTPPVLAVTDAAIVSTCVSTTLLVAAVHQTRTSDVRQAVEALARVGERPDGIVLTKSRHHSRRYVYHDQERPA